MLKQSALAAMLFVPAHSALAQAEGPPGYDEICAAILEDRTEHMAECVAAQEDAHYYVMSWLAQNGLLTEEGQVDGMQLLEAQTDPFRAMYETPASAAAFCFETTRDWIGMSQCVDLTAQQNLMMGNDPSLFGPDMYYPQPGMN